MGFSAEGRGMDFVQRLGPRGTPQRPQVPQREPERKVPGTEAWASFEAGVWLLLTCPPTPDVS